MNTESRRPVGRVLPGAPSALKQDVLGALHETVTFKQIDLRAFGIEPRAR
jgi:hypothetical protein